MLHFPQLSTGAVAQYPLTKTRTERSVINVSEDGNRTIYYDPGASLIRWKLKYAGLSDAEANTLLIFFEATEGSLQTFTFADPTVNLLLWSEDTTNAAWQKNSLLLLQPGLTDPFGNTRATQLNNSSSGNLTLAQTVNVAGGLACSFSVYARAANPTSFTISRTDGVGVETNSAVASAQWTRFVLTGSLSSNGPTSTFSLGLGPGAVLDVFGFQVDAQPAPALYLPSYGQSGVFPMSRFDSDEITVTATNVNENACELQLISQVNG